MPGERQDFTCHFSLFADGTGVPAAFRLAQPPQAFPKGAVALVYERAGEPVTGVDISQE